MRHSNGGLIMIGSPPAVVHRGLIIALAAQRRLFAIYNTRGLCYICSAKIQAAAPRNNGTRGTSGKGGSMGSIVGVGSSVGSSVSTSVAGIGWRRIGALPDTTRRT